jgi:hypothetical protein
MKMLLKKLLTDELLQGNIYDDEKMEKTHGMIDELEHEVMLRHLI